MESTQKNQRAPMRALTVVLAIAGVTWGCAGISPARMAPQAAAAPTVKLGSVRVMDVTGGRKTHFGGAQMIDDAQFKKALILALQRSGLFNEVSAERGDMDLHAVIRSEDQKVSRGLQYTATMVVTYKFTDRAGNVIWSASFDSEFSSRAFSGATRTARAREGSARENLASFLQGIREQWPKQPPDS